MSSEYICDTNLLPDGDMEAGGTGDWNASSGAILDKVTATRPGGTGTQSMQALYNATPNPGFTSVSGFEIGKTYRLTGWVNISQAGGPQPFIFESSIGELWRGAAEALSWQYFDVTFTNTTSSGPIFSSDVNAFFEYSEWDDIWLCEVDSNSTELEKTYLYKVYNAAGGYMTTWNTEVMSEPTFNQYINTGPSELKVQLAREFSNFGEGSDVLFDNKVDVYVHDRDTTAISNKKIYSGYISAYEPKINGSKESISITLLPNSSRLGFDILTASGGITTQVNFDSVDPSDIAKKILDNFTTTASGIVDYTDSSIDNTNTTVSYDFNAINYRNALDKVLQLTPENWYWRVDADNTYYLKQKNEDPDHTLTIQKEIRDIEIFKNSERIVNVVLFTGGELSDGSTLYKEYRNTSSLNAYGRRVRQVQDGRVTKESTAETISEKIINDNGIPDVRVRVTVTDNNKDRTFGYDIESFDVGETVKIIDPSQTTIESLWDQVDWDDTFWDFAQQYIFSEPLQIVSLSYSPDQAILELSSRNPEVTKRIQDIDRNLNNYITKDIEGAPS